MGRVHFPGSLAGDEGNSTLQQIIICNRGLSTCLVIVPQIHSSIYILKCPEFIFSCKEISSPPMGNCKSNRAVNYAVHFILRGCSMFLLVNTSLRLVRKKNLLVNLDCDEGLFFCTHTVSLTLDRNVLSERNVALVHIIMRFSCLFVATP